MIFKTNEIFLYPFRCNFGVMLLTEIVADRPEVQWIINLPLMLHVSFLGNFHLEMFLFLLYYLVMDKAFALYTEVFTGHTRALNISKLPCCLVFSIDKGGNASNAVKNQKQSCTMLPISKCAFPLRFLC